MVDAKFNFYADDTVIYCCASTLVQAIDLMQNAFNVVENTLFQQKLVLNTDKTKRMLFSKSRRGPQNIPSVVPLEGSEIEVVDS